MELKALLTKLVSIKSVFPNEKEEADFLIEYLEKLNYTVKKVYTSEDRYNIVAVNQKSEKYIAFYGHMDTVPADSAWSGNPWEVKFEEDLAYGLGVVDMKGGIAAILKLSEYAVERDLPVKIIFGVDEENISQGAHDLVESGELDDVEFLVVAESGQVKDTTKPFSLCYGRKGRIVFDVEVLGKSAHAAESEKGINAIEKASELINILKKENFPTHEKLGKTSLVVQKIQAESGSFSVPDFCKISFSLLTTPGYTSSDFIKLVERVGRESEINLKVYPSERPTPYGESYEMPLDNKFLKKLETEVFKKYDVDPQYMPSVADENVFAGRLDIPVLTLGAIGGEDHTKDEWVNMKSLATVVEVYKKIVTLYNS